MQLMQGNGLQTPPLMFGMLPQTSLERPGTLLQILLKIPVKLSATSSKMPAKQ